MNAKELLDLYAKGERYFLRANLSGANLHGADLRGANLSGANLTVANLRGANLHGANLRGANLSGADLRGANLSGANLHGANLTVANLRGANLHGANLRGANLSGADLRGANLSGANLHGANLSGADLGDANLSGAKGLLDPIEFLGDLEAEEGGLVVYKAFNAYFAAPPCWRSRPGEVITENVLHDRALDCACGVNVSTRQWQIEQGKSHAWKCLIEWAWLADVCVPYHTDGKFRAGRVRLIEEVELEKGK